MSDSKNSKVSDSNQMSDNDSEMVVETPQQLDLNTSGEKGSSLPSVISVEGENDIEMVEETLQQSGENTASPPNVTASQQFNAIGIKLIYNPKYYEIRKIGNQTALFVKPSHPKIVDYFKNPALITNENSDDLPYVKLYNMAQVEKTDGENDNSVSGTGKSDSEMIEEIPQGAKNDSEIVKETSQQSELLAEREKVATPISVPCEEFNAIGIAIRYDPEYYEVLENRSGLVIKSSDHPNLVEYWHDPSNPQNMLPREQLPTFELFGVSQVGKKFSGNIGPIPPQPSLWTNCEYVGKEIPYDGKIIRDILRKSDLVTGETTAGQPTALSDEKKHDSEMAEKIIKQSNNSENTDILPNVILSEAAGAIGLVLFCDLKFFNLDQLGENYSEMFGKPRPQSSVIPSEETTDSEMVEETPQQSDLAPNSEHAASTSISIPGEEKNSQQADLATKCENAASMPDETKRNPLGALGLEVRCGLKYYDADEVGEYCSAVIAKLPSQSKVEPTDIVSEGITVKEMGVGIPQQLDSAGYSKNDTFFRNIIPAKKYLNREQFKSEKWEKIFQLGNQIRKVFEETEEYLKANGDNMPNIIPGEELESIEELVNKDPDCIELELNHHRIDKLEGLEPLTKIEGLFCRWNLIKRIENLHTLTTLVELELYDNQITKIENLDALVNLVNLDLSFNRIEKIENLHNLKNLERLYLVGNKITHIDKLEMLTNLTMLELGDNKIKKIENLDSLVNLRDLFLSKNKITQIEGFDKLENLELLCLQANRIVKIEKLENLTNLRQLYISENAIEKIENLNNNTMLCILDLAKNRIKTIENIKELVRLMDLWLNDNHIREWTSVETIKNNKELTTIYLQNNLVAKDPMYRRKLKEIAPWLECIDGTLCRPI